MSNAITVAPMAFASWVAEVRPGLDRKPQPCRGRKAWIASRRNRRCRFHRKSQLRFKVELVGEVNKSGRRDLHVGRVSAMAIDAIDRDAFLAKLSPACATMRTAAAAGIVVDHDALADAGQSSRH